ncbi:hypothetical protein DVH26_23360 [Paenibacillus sp. H1-7]|uniref:hypothetical protein n=1 Tax=Paenibacillus sp. H1-7 TaxID=2282849 RepID=UPI001EF86F3F|nr:hypothetical protein [Paenibacillus sp. H1-7]ULL17121.1 hypothetical protein DVH26_23360 [Paenibacillus sp. H1-7]
MKKKYVSALVSLSLMSMSMLPVASYADEIAETPGIEIQAIKLSEDYKDLKVLSPEMKDRFDYFIQQGAFQAESDDDFGVNKTITRDEFVKVANLIFLIPDDEALSNKYKEEFEKIGIITSDGMVVDGAESISRQDLAKYLIYGLGRVDEARKITPTTDTSSANLDKVNITLSRFVTLALKLDIMKNQDDGYFYGDRLVTRRMLVEAAYETKRVYEAYKQAGTAAGKISLTEAKPIGAKKVTVSFDNPVDLAKTEKMVLTVKKEGSVVAGAAEWASDKKSATITLESKLQKGSYSIELSGLEDAEVDKKSAEFTAEDERIKELQFANPTDQLGRSKVIIEFKQVNQYGEQTQAPAGMFDIRASGSPVQTIPDKQAFKLDLSQEKRGSRVMISIRDRTNGLMVSKTFTIGDRGIVSKIDLGKLTIKDNKDTLQPGNKAYLAFTAYDQYGNLMDDLEELQDGIYMRVDGEQMFVDKGENTFVDYNNDGYPELELETETDYKQDAASTLFLTALGSGQTVSKPMSLVTLKVPASIGIKEYTSVLAEGDADKVIELEIRDAEGYAFSPQERAELVKAGKVRVRSTGDIKLASVEDGGPIPVTGGNAGNVVIKEVTGTGKASIEVELQDIDKKATAEYTLMDKRVPTAIEKLEFEPGQLYPLITEAGKSTSVKINIKDQYDEVYTPTSDEYQVLYHLQKVNGADGALTGVYSANKQIVLNDTNQSIRMKAKDVAGGKNNFSLTPVANKLGSYSLTATLVRTKKDPDETDSTKWPIITELGSLTGMAQSYTWKEYDKNDLNYYLNADTSLFAVGKYMIDQGFIEKSNENRREELKADLNDAAYIFKNRKDFTKEINIRAKNKDGIDTEIPSAPITSVTFTDPKIAAVDNPIRPTRIVGLNPGTTVAIVGFSTPGGTKILRVNLTVFTSNLAFKELKVDNTKPTDVFATEIDGYHVWDNKYLKKITVNDDLNNPFVNSADKSKNTSTEILTPLLGTFGVTITLTDVTYKPGTSEADRDTFYMTDNYKLVFKPKSGVYSKDKVNLQSFNINVTGPDGKPKTLMVNLK